jgi:hypothetical protein
MMQIDTAESSGPIPRSILICLRCDGHEGELIGGDVAVFKHVGGFMGAYSLAMKAGWKDTCRSGRRIFLGPCCSGKEPNVSD